MARKKLLKLDFLQSLVNTNRQVFAKLEDGRIVLVETAYVDFMTNEEVAGVSTFNSNGFRDYKSEKVKLVQIIGIRMDSLDGELVWSAVKDLSPCWWHKLQPKPTKELDSGFHSAWKRETAKQVLEEAKRLALSHILSRLKEAGVSEEMLMGERIGTIDYHIASILDKKSASRLTEALLEGKNWEQIDKTEQASRGYYYDHS